MLYSTTGGYVLRGVRSSICSRGGTGRVCHWFCLESSPRSCWGHGVARDQDRGTPLPLPPTHTAHATDRIRRERYASCGHTGGLSCMLKFSHYTGRTRTATTGLPSHFYTPSDLTYATSDFYTKTVYYYVLTATFKYFVIFLHCYSILSHLFSHYYHYI